MTFLLINLGLQKVPYFRGAIIQKPEITPIFLFSYIEVPYVYGFYKKKKKILSTRSSTKVDPKVPLILKFFDPTSPMVGSNPTFSFWPSRGARGT